MVTPTKDELIRVFRAIITEAMPEIQGLPYPVKAKVIRADQLARQIDAQVLAGDDNPWEDIPMLQRLDLPRGAEIPLPGALVRIGFYYNDPSLPFVDAIL